MFFLQRYLKIHILHILCIFDFLILIKSHVNFGLYLFNMAANLRGLSKKMIYLNLKLDCIQNLSEKWNFSYLLFILFGSFSFLFSENGWIPEGLTDSVQKYSTESKSLKAHFETSVTVDAECLYPCFSKQNSFTDFVNAHLALCSNNRFKNFIDSEKTLKDPHNGDFGGCFFEYNLYPVFVLPNVISIYGFEFQARDCPHGWTRYESKNFWRLNDRIIEFELADLFLKECDWQSFLLKYCRDYFIQTGYGYYGDDTCFPELEKEDLNIFVLCERALVIIFRSYRIGGWADGPHIVAVPYEKLKKYINPNGPMKEILT